MNISVIGTGYLGAVHAACMAEIGHHVLGVDSNPEQIDKLSSGCPPFFEPGLADLLTRGIAAGRLRFSGSLREAADFGEVHFICVGTPQSAGALSADITSVDAVVEGLAPHLRGECIVVGKSTVPAGTSVRLANQLAAMAPAGVRVDLAWNPEFIREGLAVQDTLMPDRIVLGVRTARTAAVLRSVYEPILAAGTPCLVTNFSTAELAKAAANAFLATKISFINAMADVCEAAGADVTVLADALGFDRRIGHGSMSAGLGFGGGCLPKDLHSLLAQGAALGVGDSLRFLHEVDRINGLRRARVVELTRELIGRELADCHVAVLGAAFKPGTDDVRDSPALAVAHALQTDGAQVRVHDPEATENARAAHPKLDYALDVKTVCEAADIVLHLTEWPQYRYIEPRTLRNIVRHPVILDARNALPLHRWRAAGWRARGLGVGITT